MFCPVGPATLVGSFVAFVFGASASVSKCIFCASSSAPPVVAPPMAAGSVQYILWRQDDNGNVFVVSRFHSRDQADRVCERYRKRGHKQLYWVKPLAPQGPPS